MVANISLDIIKTGTSNNIKKYFNFDSNEV
jgi:hypothetical protein